ncbi:hypothetical protein ACT4S2_00330 [Kocuria turfanensis]|uniref:hypothetical protein n=1 Tax=Kocuria turfanensis TaxID=388357 RepID=UPI0040375CB6
MDTPLVTAVAGVPRVVRCLDAHGRPVSLSARTLSRSSTQLQDLLRRAYTGVRGDAPAEELTVSFLEEQDGSLQLEYLVVDRARPQRRIRGRRSARGRARDSQTALTQAALVVAGAVDTLGALSAATAARWTDSDNPDFADVVLDGVRTVRVPAAVRTLLLDETALELLRGVLSMFLDDNVERVVIGRDPELQGRYHESVVSRSPALLRFLQGAPPLVGADPERS